jgi:Cu-processing system permease protein
MPSVTTVTLADAAARPASFVSNILAVAQRELRDALRSRWFLLYTIAFAALGLGVSYLSAASLGETGLAGYGRTTAGLINLVLLVVPLMALTAGAGTIASDRERGMLTYLLAQPVTRWEVLLGKYLGLSLALASCIALGLGVCAGVLAVRGQSADPGSLLHLAGLSAALAQGMLSVGLLISVLARKSSIATGSAIFTWLALVFVTDLGLMAGVLAFRMPIGRLFAISMINPVQVFKMWSLRAAEASIDVLGPAGLYAEDTFGARLPWLFAAALVAWAVAPLLAAGVIFSRRSIT